MGCRCSGSKWWRQFTVSAKLALVLVLNVEATYGLIRTFLLHNRQAYFVSVVCIGCINLFIVTKPAYLVFCLKLSKVWSLFRRASSSLSSSSKCRLLVTEESWVDLQCTSCVENSSFRFVSRYFSATYADMKKLNHIFYFFCPFSPVTSEQVTMTTSILSSIFRSHSRSLHSVFLLCRMFSFRFN